MDIAKVFELLSQGEIISKNSKAHQEYSKFLLNDSDFDEANEAFRKIGYILIGQNGYFYLSKKSNMTSTDSNRFIQKHKDIIMSIAILRTLFQRLDIGSEISFLETVVEYEAHKKNDSTIKNKIMWLSYLKNKEDEKSMLEQMFKNLEKHSIIEKVNINNENNYILLNAIDYYISIIEKTEK